MAFNIVSQDVIRGLYQEASKKRDHTSAVRHVAGLTGQDIETIESVLASSEAGEEVGVA